MLDIVKTKRFSKNLKKLRHNKKVLRELGIVLDILQSQMPIPSKYKDHELKGKFKGVRELHLGFDDLLLYIVIDEHNELILVDIDTHATTLNI